MTTIRLLLVLFFGSVTLTYAAVDIKHGQEKSMVCSACHGEKGISSQPDWPNFAGQYAAYLAKQIREFKQGKTRTAAMMSPMVAGLTEQDILDLAAFYAAQQRARGIKIPQQYHAARGRELYLSGDFSKHITACIACHGPYGTGNEQAGFPMISGQQPHYLQQQLQNFKSKQRTNDLQGIMQSICARMSDEDMEAVSYYIAGLEE